MHTTNHMYQALGSKHHHMLRFPARGDNSAHAWWRIDRTLALRWSSAKDSMALTVGWTCRQGKSGACRTVMQACRHNNGMQAPCHNNRQEKTTTARQATHVSSRTLHKSAYQQPHATQ